jgi:hypothetical protein
MAWHFPVWLKKLAGVHDTAGDVYDIGKMLLSLVTTMTSMFDKVGGDGATKAAFDNATRRLPILRFTEDIDSRYRTLINNDQITDAERVAMDTFLCGYEEPQEMDFKTHLVKYEEQNGIDKALKWIHEFIALGSIRLMRNRADSQNFAKDKLEDYVKLSDGWRRLPAVYKRLQKSYTKMVRKRVKALEATPGHKAWADREAVRKNQSSLRVALTRVGHVLLATAGVVAVFAAMITIFYNLIF